MKKKKKEQTEIEKKEISYGLKIQLAKMKNDYIRNLVNGRYFFARSNMIAEQINSGKIVEKIDGCIKSEEYIRAEYAHQKMQAIMSMRVAHFAKQDLMDKGGSFKLTNEDIHAIEEDYYDGKIVRESYDESYKKGKKAEFVNTPED